MANALSQAIISAVKERIRDIDGIDFGTVEISVKFEIRHGTWVKSAHTTTITQTQHSCAGDTTVQRQPA